MITFTVKLIGFVLGLYWFGPWFLIPALMLGFKYQVDGKLL